ncbi:nuclear autoantigenic sperm protein isoform X2 [Girardinichthys multiradiatus]|uniref:nuclear autoantigenic sperm protein isoform X2 n=1 Tax=Girardinichthys multiradiatus TaxID=208333 RepID=UPI001FAB37FD|nr:nuclear autoantigenic sperm protein isoform X2 [Girardinichthys multiradiatus]
MPEETSTASGSGSVEEKPCSSTAAAETSGEILEEAKKLIGTGKRHLVMGDVVSALSVFQDACSMLAAKYGDTADECGEAFFLYGKSLLELARMENDVLGNAMEGVPEESEEEEQPSNSNIESADNLDEKAREELRKQVYDAMTGEDSGSKVESKDVTSDTEVKDENAASEAPVKHGTGDALSSTVVGEEKSSVQGTEAVQSVSVQGVNEESEVKEEGIEESTTETEQTEEYSEGDDNEDEENDGQDNEEEDVGNLQLAWEMLELSKVIFKRKESKDDQLMAAQAYLKLGEVSAETGNYPQALEDFQECLTMQLKHLPPHSRLLAETHYHVATTLCSMDQYNQAIQHYNSSIKVIETRLAMLQEIIDGDDGAAEEKSEMEELNQLLPDIREKVDDAKESQRTASAASQAIQQTLGTPSTSTFPCENGGPSSSTAFASSSQIPVKTSGSASSSKAVSDISHLVRKRPSSQAASVEFS